VKRESGGNPEQTRCCKLRQDLWIRLKTTVSTNEMGRVFKEGVSQKTCQNKLVTKLSRNKAWERESKNLCRLFFFVVL
jgi:hypothetical protein